MRIALGSDHRGFALKEKLKAKLILAGYSVADFGTDSPEAADYPDFACRVAKAVTGRRAERGVLICGTGIGMSIAANRVRGVRAALCDTPRLARMSRRHNNANVLCIGSEVLTQKQALRILDAWLGERFEGGRHTRRVRKLESCL